MIKKIKKNNRLTAQAGDVLVMLLIVIAIFGTVMPPIIFWAVTTSNLIRETVAREQALQIAEAGVDYYEWHLAHFPTDYQDGTNNSGPYVHNYTDNDTQNVLGQYSLVITPPVTGSTVVTIASTGDTASNPSIKRTVTVKYGIPSLAAYSLLSNDTIWIGPSETVNGPIQSNNGIRFDGTGNAPIISAKATYTCDADEGSPCPATENGVWGSASPTVQSFWQFPAPAVDFSSLTSNLATLKNSAQSGGIYLPPSNANGYSLVFNSNGTVSVYKVTSLQSDPTGWDVYGNAHNENIDYNNRSLQYTVAIPHNGIIYVEDNTWVEGVVNGRVTVATANLPYTRETAPNIYIQNNITYKMKDGTDALGLMAQNSIVVTYGAPSELEIDAAMIAQNGSVEFFDYPDGSAVKDTLSVDGTIMSFGKWTWNWVDTNNNNVSGYGTTNDTYDNNLLYASPPGFPLSSSGYEQISWQSN